MSFELYDPGIAWIITAGIFAISFLVQLFYYLFFFLRLALYRSNDADAGTGKSVSIIICARDEAENLAKNLPVVLEQDYPDYEVVVVNDSSEDNTEEVLDRLKEKYSNLRSTRIRKDQKFRHGKKLALTIGLKAAKHEWALLTDADCRPASPLWITRMQNHFKSPNEVVLGYGSYERRKGFLNKMVRYDTFFTALQYLSFAMAGIPYMGVGRNLAYRRPLFFANKGFASHLGLSSGDDDLFINEVAEKGNTALEASHDAHTISSPPESWTEWFRQKRRHLTAGFRYRLNTRFLLGLEISSRFAFYLTFVLLLLNKIFIPYVISLFVIRMITSFLIINPAMNRLNEKKLFVFLPLLDILVFLFNFICVAGNLFMKKSSRWR